MDDVAWLSLCVWDEARGEPQEGKCAVAKVVMNRAARKYQSDGTIKGTVLAPGQFSGFWFDMIDGHYTRVCHTLAEAEARAAKLFVQAIAQKLTWAACEDAAEGVYRGNYVGSIEYDKLGDKAVLYLNPDVLDHLPSWADPAMQLAVIGHHHFYRA